MSADTPKAGSSPSKLGGMFGASMSMKERVLDQDLPKDDPFKPGSNKPQVDPIRKGKPKPYKEIIIGRRGIEAEDEVRVWLALGVRGMGVPGEEGIGSITQVPTQGEAVVKWDSTGLEHTYLVGRYNVHQLAVFDYMVEKEWMLYTHEVNFHKHNSNKVKPPVIEKAKELQVMLGYRMDKQLQARVTYAPKTCGIL